MSRVASPAHSDAVAATPSVWSVGPVDTQSLPLTVLRLTAVLLMLYGASSVGVQAILVILTGAMLVFDPLLRWRSVWWILVAVLVCDNVRQWSLIDNHKYLISYWAVICAAWVSSSLGFDRVATTARQLVGVVFVAAVAWKLVAGQYLSGLFFYFTFITDYRIARLGALLVGTGTGDVGLAREAVTVLADLGGAGHTLVMPVSEGLALASIVMSYLTLAVEGAVGLLHLVPSGRVYWLRHASLLAFICCTYVLLPVVAFAFTLCVLGLSQVREGDMWLKRTYVIVCGLVQLTQVPWQQLLVG
jgi:hypothetical protein